MTPKSLSSERQTLLALELLARGVDVHRLGFLRWLIEQGQDPEWAGHGLPAQAAAQRSSLI